MANGALSPRARWKNLTAKGAWRIISSLHCSRRLLKEAATFAVHTFRHHVEGLWWLEHYLQHCWSWQNKIKNEMRHIFVAICKNVGRNLLSKFRHHLTSKQRKFYWWRRMTILVQPLRSHNKSNTFEIIMVFMNGFKKRRIRICKKNSS